MFCKNYAAVVAGGGAPANHEAVDCYLSCTSLGYYAPALSESESASTVDGFSLQRRTCSLREGMLTKEFWQKQHLSSDLSNLSDSCASFSIFQRDRDRRGAAMSRAESRGG